MEEVMMRRSEDEDEDSDSDSDGGDGGGAWYDTETIWWWWDESSRDPLAHSQERLHLSMLLGIRDSWSTCTSTWRFDL